MHSEGILLIDKPRGRTSFSLVAHLRKVCGVKKIGHAGTLDPFATGVMVMLIGKAYTKMSDQLLTCDKEYAAKIHLGISTNTYDCEGEVVATSARVPTLEEIHAALTHFQGTVDQIPPMFSAKKMQGKKLYELARRGIEIPRPPKPVTLDTTFISYQYPFLELKVACSKGTYIRSIAHDLGERLGCGAFLTELVRTRSGPFHIQDCISLSDPNFICTLPTRLIKSLPSPLLVG